MLQSTQATLFSTAPNSRLFLCIITVALHITRASGLIYLSPAVYKMSENAAAGWDMMTQRHHGSPHNVVYTKTLAPRNLPRSKPQECVPASLLRWAEQRRTNLRCSPAALLSLMGNTTQKQHSGSTGAFMLLRGCCYLVWQLQRSAGGELRPDAVCVCLAGIVKGGEVQGVKSQVGGAGELRMDL